MFEATTYSMILNAKSMLKYFLYCMHLEQRLSVYTVTRNALQWIP